MRWRRRKSEPGPQLELTASSAADIVVPDSSSPLISILVVTFGGADVVTRCLASIVAATDASRWPYEVIVVDNADSEGGERQPTATTTAVRTRTSGVRLVPSAQNTGFGGGNNLAAQHARAPFLCLCNPDIQLAPGWAEPLLAALDDPLVGVAAPALVNPDGTPQEFGQVLLDSGFTLAVGGEHLFPGDWSQAAARVVDYASAAFWLTRRDLFHELGGFDPRYHPAYWEDVDLALRVEDAGYVTVLVPDVRVVHEKGGSSEASIALAQRSHSRFVERWAERLRAQPAHPSSDQERIAARDAAARRLQTP